MPIDPFLPIGELAPLISAGALSALDLTNAALERIAALDPTLHAFVTVTADAARAQARALDRERRAGKSRGPLHGIPYAAKDLLATRGVPTTWGATPLSGQMFDRDATVIRRLREAGAVLVGKLAMIELAGGLGYTIPGASATGAARNPWDTGRWTCGSSSGAGAAVAAGLVPFAIGSETWGSIVCPSSFTGITGLRPTFGRVSRAGAMVLSWTLDKIGPMARSARDCEIVLGAIAGADPDDEWSAHEPPPAASVVERARALRVGVVRLDFSKGGEPEVQAAFEAAIRDLQQSGVRVEEVTLPPLPFEEVASVFVTCEALVAFEELFRDGRVHTLADADAPLAMVQGRAISGSDYVKAARIRTVCQKAIASFFGDWDLLLAPGELMTAFPADRSFADVTWSDPIGAMGNLCGLPALAIPCGFGKGHLPASLQIVGGAFEEPKVLALGRYFQQITDWHTQRPPMHTPNEQR